MARANGRHNLHVLEQAIAYHLSGSAGFRSRGEASLYQAIEAAGLPLPLVNTKLNGEEVDLHWPELKLAVEVDGTGHARPRTMREDALKTRLWREAGYEVLRTAEHRCHPIASDSSGRSVIQAVRGGVKRTRIWAPPPGALAASTLPPWASAAWRAIASPRPEPGFPRASSAR